MYFFTICSNNYLAQAIVLGNSIKRYYPEHTFLTILVDEKHEKINYDEIPFEVIPIHEIEPAILSLVEKYSIIELNTCVKPRVFEYLFNEKKAGKAIYFDPDIKLYTHIEEIEKALDTNNVVLTPHIYTPIPLDGKGPGENTFLNYGTYNLGFIGVKNSDESGRFIKWWKERTYEMGYFKVHIGVFVDQLWINHVPLFFKDVYVLKDKGCNMAPWNLHERFLTDTGKFILVNGSDALKFFHFSSFKVDTGELPVHNYNRYYMKDRPDLVELYKQYNEELKAAGYSFYSGFTCAYMTKRKQYLRQQWKRKPLLKRIAIRTARIIPGSIRNAMTNV
jgi:hypothetical protein